MNIQSLGYRALLKNGNVKALLLAYSLNIFAVSYLIGYYLNITLASIGGPALVGLFATISNVFAGFLPLVAGAFADSHGRRYVILVSAVLEVLALLSLALVAGSGGKLIVLPAVMLSASFTASSPALFSLVGESVPQDCMGKGMSLLFMASSASGILSYIAFGSMIGRISNSRLFALSALFVLISILFYLRVSETVERRAGRTFERFREALEGVTLLKEPPLKLFMAYLCFELFVSSIASPFVPMFLQKVYSLSVSQISWLYSAIGFATLMGAFIAGYVVDRIGSLDSLILKDSLSVPLLVLFALAPFSGAFLSLAALAFIEQLNVASNRYVVENTRWEHRGLILGFKSSLAKLSAVPGPAIGTILWGIGPELAFLLPALLTPLGILILLKLKSLQTVSRGF
ncbi:MFS transporter [Thermococcus henrietii]|uniref:MFS transporter n=1 Tax=Thermococcus henrietii TaxID=2016361 RepID=UPI001314D2DE|nr:MFS transporter [Thermococcus henrietii]